MGPAGAEDRHCCNFKGGRVPSALWDLVELDVLDLGEMDLDIVVTVVAHQLKWLCYFSLEGNKTLLLASTYGAGRC